jgi:uncharacterized protein YndB with AHSA1/START domain
LTWHKKGGDYSFVRLTTSFEVAIPRDRVAAYLADPRHLLVANRTGPIVERSDGPLAAGSWFVLAFDQLRARVEYTAYEPPYKLAATVSMTGRGSGGMTSSQDFVLSEVEDGRATRVDASAEGTPGFIRWAPLIRASQSLTWRHLRQRIETSA